MLAHQGQKRVYMREMREAGLHKRRNRWCTPREVKKLEQGLEEDTETIFLLLITELPSTGKRTGSGEVLIHKCSSYSRRHRVVVSGLEPHTGEFPFLFLSLPAVLGRSQGKRQRSNIAQQLLTVCIRHDDIWALPSKLQGHPLEVTLCCSLLDQVSNLQGEQSRCWN